MSKVPTGIPAVYGPVVPDRYANNPGPFNPGVVHANPTRAVPGPGHTQNLGYWPDQQKFLRFSAIVAPINVPAYSIGFGEGGFATASVARALWQTPTFDLRPDLGASAGPDNTLGYPIMRPFGGGGMLTINITGVAMNGDPVPQALTEFNIVEFGHPTDPSRMLPLGLRKNVTSAVLGGVQGGFSILTVAPPANPLRYWAAALVVDFGVAGVDNVNDAPSTLNVWGANQ